MRRRGGAGGSGGARGTGAELASERRAGDRFARLHGLYWLVANLAAERPLLLPSTTPSGPTSRACASSPTSRGAWRELPVVAADRVAAAAARPRTARSSRRSPPRPRCSRPAPLSETAIATLAGRDADPAFVTAVHTATAGNALLVEELLADARECIGSTRIPGV